jgi:hypothetical protein
MYFVTIILSSFTLLDDTFTEVIVPGPAPQQHANRADATIYQSKAKHRQTH